MTYRPENGKGQGDGNRSKNKSTVIKNVLKKSICQKIWVFKAQETLRAIIVYFKSILTDALNKQNAKPQEVLQSKIRRL